MFLYVCDCTNVVYMLCAYCINKYVNKFQARSLFYTSPFFYKEDLLTYKNLPKICYKIYTYVQHEIQYDGNIMYKDFN